MTSTSKRSHWRRRRVDRSSSQTHSTSRTIASSASRSRASHTPSVMRTISRRSRNIRSSVASAQVQSDPDRTDHTVGEDRTIGSAQDDTDTADSLNEVIMAVDMRDRGTVGCAYYVAQNETLYFMEDLKLGGMDAIEALKLYISPTIALTPTKIDDTVLGVLNPEESVGSNESSLGLPYLLDMRPTSEFRYESAKTKLAGLGIEEVTGPYVSFVVPGDVISGNESTGYGFDTKQGNILRLASWIDAESRITVGCAGAIISYLQRRRAAAVLPGDDAANLIFQISKLEMFTLRNTMFINEETLLSLQIMQSESHPHFHNQGPTSTASSGSKEALSIYGLFHHLARTPQGKYLLRQNFLRPSLNIETINERLDAITSFLRPENAVCLENLVKSLKNVVNLRPVIIKLRKGANDERKGIKRSVWSNIRTFLFHAIGIRDVFKEMQGAEEIAIRNKMLEQLDTYNFALIGRNISDVIDFDSSAEDYRTVVNAGVDENLDEMKRFHDGMNEFLGEVGLRIVSKMPANLGDDLRVVFWPRYGFLITLPLDPYTGTSIYMGEAEDTWESIFAKGDIAYLKNKDMQELDNYYGDIWGRICDREIEIVHELAQYVLEFEHILTVASDMCGELDSILALAQGAQQYKLVRPRVTEENLIKIKGGRHPLQERTVSSFVPNDTLLVGDEGNSDGSMSEEIHENGPSMVLLTGPNYSGKSVYLKQVALIVFMAHLGSFVPAEHATIGLTDKILTRISTRESVSKIQSAFMIDLQQMSFALNLATNRSLLVIDEFGRGTDASDGAGIACGILEHLLSLGRNCPKVVAATHFHEIFENNFLKPRPKLEFAHMEVRIADSSSAFEDQITYLYNYRKGRSTSSFGTICAALNGISPEIVERAQEFLIMSARGEDLVAAGAEMSEAEATELEEAESLARRFLGLDLDEEDPRMKLNRILMG